MPGGLSQNPSFSVEYFSFLQENDSGKVFILETVDNESEILFKTYPDYIPKQFYVNILLD
jgi:hypothetical protein